MGKITQDERVLEYMQKFGEITSLDAFRDLRITRLSAKIFNLKKQGYEIIDEMKEATNRFRETTHFKKYMLVEDKFIQDNENHISRID